LKISLQVFFGWKLCGICLCICALSLAPQKETLAAKPSTENVKTAERCAKGAIILGALREVRRNQAKLLDRERTGYFQRRADFATEDPRLQKLMLDKLYSSAPQVIDGFFSNSRPENLEKLFSIFSRQGRQVSGTLTDHLLLGILSTGPLHALESSRIDEFYEPLRRMLIKTHGKAIRRESNYRLLEGTQAGAANDVIMGILNEHFVEKVLRGSFDRARGDHLNADAKFYFMLVIFDRLVADTRRAYRARSRGGDLPSLSLDFETDPEDTQTSSLSPEAKDLLLELFSLLEKEDQDIFRRSFVDNKSDRLVAKDLGLPPGTLKSRIRRAKSRWAELLEEHEVSIDDFRQ
jgi:hypothetical protein